MADKCDYQFDECHTHHRHWAECEIESLRSAWGQAKADLETERMRLAACGVAAMANTPGTASERIGRDNPCWSASYGDVCRAVDAEIAARTRAEAAEKERDELRGKLDDASRSAIYERAVAEKAEASLADAQEEVARLRAALDKIVAHTYEQTTLDIACAALSKPEAT